MEASPLGQTIQIQGAISLSDHGIGGDEGEYVLLPVETEDGETQNALVTAAAAESLIQQQILQTNNGANVVDTLPTINNNISLNAVKQEPQETSVQTVGANDIINMNPVSDQVQQTTNMTTVITAFVCPVCGMTFQRRAALMSHGKIHPEFQNHKCTICGKTFTRLDFVKRHVRSHLGYPHECQECHRSYKEQDELNAHHVKIHMKTRKIHACVVCGKVLKNAFNLKEHMRVHTGDKPFLCDACPMRFARSVDLRNHQFVHNEDLRYFCHICGKRFRRPEGRRIHLRNHTGVKPYKCTICDKGFAGRSSYNIHYRNHHRTTPPAANNSGGMTDTRPAINILRPNTTATLSTGNVLQAVLQPGQTMQSALQQALQ